MEPRPLFPTKIVKSMSAEFRPNIRSPKVPKSPTVVPKPLFPGKGVSADIEADPFYKNHPLCQKLGNKDLARVRNVVNSANLSDTAYVLNYANELRTKFSDLINHIMNLAHDSEAGQMQSLSTDCLEIIGNMSTAKILKPTYVAWWHILLGSATIQQRRDQLDVDKYIATIADWVVCVEKYLDLLSSQIQNTVSRADELDELFAANRENFDFLDLYVIAGRIIVEKHVQDILPKLRAKVDETDMFQVQEYNHFKDCVDRFERKIDDLNLTAHMVLTNVPQIQLLKNNAKNMAEHVQRLVLNVAPAWKQHTTRLLNAIKATRAKNLKDAIKITQKTQQPIITAATSAHAALTALFTK